MGVEKSRCKNNFRLSSFCRDENIVHQEGIHVETCGQAHLTRNTFQEEDVFQV